MRKFVSNAIQIHVMNVGEIWVDVEDVCICRHSRTVVIATGTLNNKYRN